MPLLKAEQILNQVTRLYPMPSTATRVLKALEDTYVSASHVSELISLDQALAASVLQMANSASLGYAQKCSSINEAVMMLGFAKLKVIILGVGSIDTLNRPLHGYRLKRGELWNHSVATAMAAQWLARTLKFSNPEELYVAGLLHDIGKVLLDQYLNVDYDRVILTMKQNKASLAQVEMALYGVDHAGIGGMLAKKWNYPPLLVDAIQFHHHPSLSFDNDRVAAIVNIATAFATREAIGLTDPYGSIVHPESMWVLNLTDKDIDDLRKAMYANFGLTAT